MRNFYESDNSAPAVPGLPEATQTDNLEHPKPLGKPLSGFETHGNHIETLPQLESVVSQARKSFLVKYNDLKDSWDSYTAIANDHFQMTVDKVKSNVSEKDEFLPNSLNVLSAALLGSILTSRRGIFLRVTTPWILAGVACKFALPNTFDNISNNLYARYYSLESSKFPQLTESRKEIAESVKEFRKSLQNESDAQYENLTQQVHNLRQSVKNLYK